MDRNEKLLIASASTLNISGIILVGISVEPDDSMGYKVTKEEAFGVGVMLLLSGMLLSGLCIYKNLNQCTNSKTKSLEDNQSDNHQSIQYLRKPADPNASQRVRFEEDKKDDDVEVDIGSGSKGPGFSFDYRQNNLVEIVHGDPRTYPMRPRSESISSYRSEIGLA